MKTDVFDADKNQSSRVSSRFSVDLPRLTSEAEQVKAELDPQVSELFADMQEKAKKISLPKKE